MIDGYIVCTYGYTSIHMHMCVCVCIRYKHVMCARTDLFISHYSHVFDAMFVGPFNVLPLPLPAARTPRPIRHVVVIIYGAKEASGNKTLHNVV